MTLLLVFNQDLVKIYSTVFKKLTGELFNY